MEMAHPVAEWLNPEELAESLSDKLGLLLLRSSSFHSNRARYSFLFAEPFLIFTSRGAQCDVTEPGGPTTSHFGNPWALLDRLMNGCELLHGLDLPFPLGACAGFWGYDLKHFVEPKLARRSHRDLDLPDCWLGFYDSLVVFDHWLQKIWIVSTGLNAEGEMNRSRAEAKLAFWKGQIASARQRAAAASFEFKPHAIGSEVLSNLSAPEFIRAVEAAQRYIRAGHIYQVNLSQRFAANLSLSPWELFLALSSVSPTAFGAFLQAGSFQIASSSPELFLRMSGGEITTRPIKGTRPRAEDPTRDAQLSYELQTSPKELSELVMITDLLRNDLGKICEFGSVQTPDLVRLERYAHVQHLVSTVTGRLRSGVTQAQALGSAFPGGSVTGAPKFRAMEIIEELEPLSRGPYTGALGYLGFNQESQLSVLIRTAICLGTTAYYHAGSGIVSDSDPAAEYQETLDKAQPFFSSLTWRRTPKLTTPAMGSDKNVAPPKGAATFLSPMRRE